MSGPLDRTMAMTRTMLARLVRATRAPRRSPATVLRLRDLDKCIGCYACERACAERHGAQRLFLNGKVVGRLDFVSCCRTCEDRPCVSACDDGAIELDAASREVIIHDDRCTGCAACARACPYDAITIFELDRQPVLRARVNQRLRAAGPGNDRDFAHRRIASKCDHCAGYGDRACISACPTDAIYDVAPEALLRRERGPAWRSRWPWLGAAPLLGLCAVAGRPSSRLGLGLGVAAALLMLSTGLLSLFKRAGWMGRLRLKAPQWFDYHVFAGTAGALCAALHAGGNLNPRLSGLETASALPALIGLWLAVAMAISGLAGRYLAVVLPWWRGVHLRGALLLGVVVLLHVTWEVVPARKLPVIEPGPRSAVHQGLGCARCHESRRALPQDKCLGCHTEIAGHVREGRGLHGRQRGCPSCHQEHRGVDLYAAGWLATGGREAFRHDLTGFPLTGFHAALGRARRCGGCHKDAPARFLGAPAQCSDRACHGEDVGPVHGGALRDRCQCCHSPKGWKPARPACARQVSP